MQHWNSIEEVWWKCQICPCKSLYSYNFRNQKACMWMGRRYNHPRACFGFDVFDEGEVNQQTSILWKVHNKRKRRWVRYQFKVVPLNNIDNNDHWTSTTLHYIMSLWTWQNIFETFLMTLTKYGVGLSTSSFHPQTFFHVFGITNWMSCWPSPMPFIWQSITCTHYISNIVNGLFRQ